ncbi:MAG: YidC/Oxa1 family membrane protein insertase [Butyrivibrio sp.]|nr:YidC/Oxa1 family membrane protein insertase [Butyrivibrio sp.]
MKGVLLTQYEGKIVGPVAWLLGHLMNGIFNVLNSIGIPNIGLSIIIFTIVIYLCLLPLTYKQQKFSKLQSKMSPELQAIQAKYKGKKDNDSMLAMQQETKEVYAKYGVSQTGSCLQLIIQMPILFALYRVIYSIPAYVTIVRDAFSPLVEDLMATAGASEFLQNLSSAKAYSKQFTSEAFLAGDSSIIKNTFIDVLNKASSADWASLTSQFPSLSASIENTHSLLNRYNYFLGLNIGDTPMYMIQTAFTDKHFALLIGGIIVPFLAAFTQWLNVKLMPQAANNGKIDPDDPTAQMQQSMKTMNLMMPIMSAFFCLNLPAGMGIYWIAGAVVRSIQQVVINKHIDKIDIDAEIAKNTAKYKEKLEKNKTTRQMNLYANLSTKNNDLSGTNSSSKISDSEKEAQMKKVSDIYGSGNIRKDSLLAKANMVKEFNEKNNK